MGQRMVERRLRRTGTRLRGLREELAVIDEQMAHLLDDADDASIRALVSENAGVGTEHRHAQAHADAMAAHRAHVIADIRSHELRQDDLLDALARR